MCCIKTMCNEANNEVVADGKPIAIVSHSVMPPLRGVASHNSNCLNTKTNYKKYNNFYKHSEIFIV